MYTIGPTMVPPYYEYHLVCMYGIQYKVSMDRRRPSPRKRRPRSFQPPLYPPAPTDTRDGAALDRIWPCSGYIYERRKKKKPVRTRKKKKKKNGSRRQLLITANRVDKVKVGTEGR